MSKQPPADELAETLIELARLNRRADQLRAQIVQNPGLGMTGRFARATVALRLDRVFDPALLPPEVRTDPRYLRDQPQWIVTCQELPRATGPRPGWPIRRDVATALH